MKTALVLMTALVPTLGHKALIDFAADLVGRHGYVNVFLSSRSFEPVAGYYRSLAFTEACTIHGNDCVEIFNHEDDNAPQNPTTDVEWQYWHDVVSYPYSDRARYEKYDYVVASEPYGKKMAELLGAEFIPFDLDRKIIKISGTQVRSNIPRYYDFVLPEFKDIAKLDMKVTFFGQESTGKTTMTNRFARESYGPKSVAVHEFARPYIEAMDDKTITPEIMETVMYGQYALQKAAYRQRKFYTFQDTDLLSTIGYSHIYNGRQHPKIQKLFEETKSDLYIVMNDAIPFEPDALRYGGHERESTTQFWIDLLEKNNCKYYVVQNTDQLDQSWEISDVIFNAAEAKLRAIQKFERE